MASVSFLGGIGGAKPSSVRPPMMACGANSFVAGTDVLMGDGSTKDIDDVEVGDEVWASDPETGERGPREVTALITGSGTKSLVEVTLEGGGRVTATEGHPFWVNSEGAWVDADDLEVGYLLLTPDGVTRIEAVEHRTEAAAVFNLTVADIHTYHVLAGNEPVLVHNCLTSELRGLPRGSSGSVRLLPSESAVRNFYSRHTGGGTQANRNYGGISQYELPDGTWIGLRQSKRFGLTIDVQIPGQPYTKIHIGP